MIFTALKDLAVPNIVIVMQVSHVYLLVTFGAIKQ